MPPSSPNPLTSNPYHERQRNFCLPSAAARPPSRACASARDPARFLFNEKPVAEYCYTDQLRMIATRPLACTGLQDSVDAQISVKGGGPVGQAGAISLGIARALEKMDAELRAPIKRRVS